MFNQDFNQDFQIMTDTELIKLIKNLTKGPVEWDSLLLAKKLTPILGELTKRGSNEGMSRLELDFVNNHIVLHGTTEPLSYDEVVEYVNNTDLFVTLMDTDGEYLLPQYNDGGAIVFTGLNIFSSGTYAHRIALNTDNEIKAEYYELAMRNSIGDTSGLHTDHKSNLVEAINELADIIETNELVVSMSQSAKDRKAIYDLVVAHPQLAKEIVFYNVSDQLYYRVNGYNIINGVLALHVIMKDGTLMDKQVQIGANGSIAIV